MKNISIYHLFALFLLEVWTINSGYSLEISKVSVSDSAKGKLIRLAIKGNTNFIPDYEIKNKKLNLKFPKMVNGNIKELNRFFDIRKNNASTVFISKGNVTDVSAIEFNFSNNAIEFLLPISPIVTVEKKQVVTVNEQKPIVKFEKENLDEEYLSYLVGENKAKESFDQDKNGKRQENKGKNQLESKVLNADKVKERLGVATVDNKVTKSVFAGKDTGSFSYLLLKFSGILGIVILLFLVCIKFFKVVVQKKGKMNFFKNPNIIQVIEQNHIGPKKSIMLLKVHDQLILVSNTDSGVHFISEVSDPEQALNIAIKNADNQNFDHKVENNIVSEQNLESKIKLKDLNNLEKSSNTTAQKLKDRVSKIRSYV
jgi:flagellar biogenesis protein FliO